MAWRVFGVVLWIGSRRRTEVTPWGESINTSHVCFFTLRRCNTSSPHNSCFRSIHSTCKFLREERVVRLLIMINLSVEIHCGKTVWTEIFFFFFFLTQIDVTCQHKMLKHRVEMTNSNYYFIWYTSCSPLQEASLHTSDFLPQSPLSELLFKVTSLNL